MVLLCSLVACGLGITGQGESPGGDDGGPTADSTSDSQTESGGSDGTPAADVSTDSAVEAPTTDSPVFDGPAQDVDLDAPSDVTPDVPSEADADAGIDAGADADAGSVLTISGGSYVIYAQGGGGCSPNGSQMASFALTNMRAASVDVYWVDFNCSEVLYLTVMPNGTQQQQTYVDHVWRVRDHGNQAFLAEFILTQPASYTIIVH